MRTILFYIVELLARFVGYMVRAVSTVLNPKTYDPMLRRLGNVVAQVFGVKYTFDKHPCSATGGTA